LFTAASPARARRSIGKRGEQHDEPEANNCFVETHQPVNSSSTAFAELPILLTAALRLPGARRCNTFGVIRNSSSNDAVNQHHHCQLTESMRF
jgi:hypothetical protein